MIVVEKVRIMLGHGILHYRSGLMGQKWKINTSGGVNEVAILTRPVYRTIIQEADALFYTVKEDTDLIRDHHSVRCD